MVSVSCFEVVLCEPDVRDKLIVFVIYLPKMGNITVLDMFPFVLHLLLNYFLPSYFCVPYSFRVTCDCNER